VFSVVDEPFSKWGTQVHVKKLWKIFVAWIGSCDVASSEIWCHSFYQHVQAILCNIL